MTLAELSTKILVKALTRSPWISHMNAGSCNGCDIEIVAALSPRYDIERFGITLQGSPRHADVLVCTGSVTRAMAPRLKEIYDEMSSPKLVIVVGGCGIDGGVYQNCYNVLGGIDKLLPVDLYIPGCPPRPEAIVYGVYILLKSLEESVN
ncbi:MAG: putative membrane-bound hydrogenase subunit mbhJ [Candidatus Heimdallarchaeota archaeon LC_2]|nr:MAG: putative membrane-bound hydrogenase subunit mbhJ [Candidatus Heimdallarchaeota archaeon LC_2]